MLVITITITIIIISIVIIIIIILLLLLIIISVARKALGAGKVNTCNTKSLDAKGIKARCLCYVDFLCSFSLVVWFRIFLF